MQGHPAPPPLVVRAHQLRHHRRVCSRHAHDLERVHQPRRLPPVPLQLRLGALCEQRDLPRQHRRREQVGDGGPVRLRRQHRVQPVQVEPVSLVLQLLHQLEDPLLPHPEVDHPRDDPLPRAAPDPRQRVSPGAPGALAQPGDQPRQPPDARRLPRAALSNQQHRRRGIGLRQLLEPLLLRPLADDRRHPPPRRLLHQLLGHGPQRRVVVVVLVVVARCRPLGPVPQELRQPRPHVLVALTPKVVEPRRLLPQQRAADRVTQCLRRHLQVLHQQPPAEARQHHAVGPAGELHRHVGQLQRHPLLADHRALLHQGHRVRRHVGPPHIERLVPQVAREGVVVRRPLGQLYGQLLQHVLLVAAVGGRRRLVEEGVPAAQQHPAASPVGVGDEVDLQRSLGHYDAAPAPSSTLIRSSQSRRSPSASVRTFIDAA